MALALKEVRATNSGRVSPMRTLFLIFVFALTTIAFEVYSDAVLTSAEVPRAVPDPVTEAVAHALNHN